MAPKPPKEEKKKAEKAVEQSAEQPAEVEVVPVEEFTNDIDTD
jgi:hypothetical protein